MAASSIEPSQNGAADSALVQRVGCTLTMLAALSLPKLSAASPTADLPPAPPRFDQKLPPFPLLEHDLPALPVQSWELLPQPEVQPPEEAAPRPAAETAPAVKEQPEVQPQEAPPPAASAAASPGRDETPDSVGSISADRQLEGDAQGRNSMWEFGAKMGLAALATVGALSALRGTIKMGNYIYEWCKARRNFAAGRCLSAPSTNLHNVSEENGLCVLERTTVHQPKLEDIFRNAYAHAIFNRACSLCTPEQPFPHLNFGRANANLAESSLAACGLWRLPDERALIREFNQLLTGYYSSLQHEGAFRQDAGLPVARDYHIVIPIVEVVRKQSRDLVFIVISRDNFELFGQADEVARLLHDNPHLERRILQLREAYELHAKFLVRQLQPAVTAQIPSGHPALSEQPTSLFPWVRVYEKLSKNALNGKPAAKNDAMLVLEGVPGGQQPEPGHAA